MDPRDALHLSRIVLYRVRMKLFARFQEKVCSLKKMKYRSRHSKFRIENYVVSYM